MDTVIRRKRVKGRAKTCGADWRNPEKEYVAWWYHKILRNQKQQAQPAVEVIFREINGNELTNRYLPQKINIAELGQVQLGSIWRNKRSREIVAYEERDFIVDYTPHKWRFTSRDFEIKKNKTSAFPDSAYELKYERDKNWLISFSRPDGGALLIPCLVFYSRCYGRSGELRRILATYPWKEASFRMFSELPPDIQVEPNQWPVVLGKSLSNGDTLIAAHAMHDSYTQRALSYIYPQLDQAYSKKQLALLKIGPWHTGMTKIRVRGVSFNNGNSFLALQIVGSSEPDGPLILRTRKNRNDPGLLDEEGKPGEAWDGVPGIVNNPQDVDLTDGYDPDSNTVSVELEDDDFLVIGNRRQVKKIKTDTTKSTSGSPGDDHIPGQFATSETLGDGDNVGSASTHSNTVYVSEGILKDFWDALNLYKVERDGYILNVDWFTFEDGFSSAEEPKAIALKPFSETELELLGTARKSWPYIDFKNREMRGVLVTRVITANEVLYFIEIQRKQTSVAVTNKVNEKDSEGYKGLAIHLENENDFLEVLNHYLSQVRIHYGVVGNIDFDSKCKTYAFPHYPLRKKKEHYIYQAAVKNAFKKILELIYGKGETAPSCDGAPTC